MPASIAQERLCELQHALPDLPFLNILYALRLTSSLDVAVLERSINEIVRRHEILRTTFAVENGRYVQVIAQQLTVPLRFEDLRGLPRIQDGDRRTSSYSEKRRFIPLTSREGHCCGLACCAWPSGNTSCSSAMHQVICDGWSLGVLVEELTALYDAFSAGRQTPLAPLSIQYADFAHWQRQWRSHPEIVAQLAYWREQLRDPLPAMRLASAGPRRTIDDLRTARREVALPAEAVEGA